MKSFLFFSYTYISSSYNVLVYENQNTSWEEYFPKDGKTEITGREEDETLYRLMVANIKEFA